MGVDPNERLYTLNTSQLSYTFIFYKPAYTKYGTTSRMFRLINTQGCL